MRSKKTKQEGWREKIKEIIYSERVGFLYAVGDDDLLIDELAEFVEEEKEKSFKEGIKKGKKMYLDVITEKVIEGRKNAKAHWRDTLEKRIEDNS
jgi:hypothetical protein